jgi:enterochelin esterase-like enzyme
VGAVHLLAALAAAFVLPGFSPVSTGPDGGQVLSGRFPGTLRPGYVYLPPGFDPRRRYPVLYLLHGLPGSPSEYLGGTQLAPFADRGIARGALRPFIAVMPAAGASHAYGGEWAGRWEDAIVDDVVPWVDAHLPTIRAPAGRVIAGLSGGGFGAVDIALRHLGLFGAVESWSGYFTPLPDQPFVHADRATLDANNPTLLVPREAAALRAARVRFFVSTGPYHSHWIPRGTSQAFALELRRAGVPVTLRVFPSKHREWRNQLDAGLDWAFARA